MAAHTGCTYGQDQKQAESKANSFHREEKRVTRNDWRKGIGLNTTG